MIDFEANAYLKRFELRYLSEGKTDVDNLMDAVRRVGGACGFRSRDRRVRYRKVVPINLEIPYDRIAETMREIENTVWKGRRGLNDDDNIAEAFSSSVLFVECKRKGKYKGDEIIHQSEVFSLEAGIEMPLPF